MPEIQWYLCNYVIWPVCFTCSQGFIIGSFQIKWAGTFDALFPGFQSLCRPHTVRPTLLLKQQHFSFITRYGTEITLVLIPAFPLHGSHFISASFIFPLCGAGYHTSLSSKVSQSLINLEKKEWVNCKQERQRGEGPGNLSISVFILTCVGLFYRWCSTAPQTWRGWESLRYFPCVWNNVII